MHVYALNRAELPLAHPPPAGAPSAVAGAPPERSPTWPTFSTSRGATSCCSTAPWAARSRRATSRSDDFWGQENCSEILNLSRPDLIREIHLGYLARRRRRGRDQQLRRLADHARRVRARGAGARDQRARAPSWPARRSSRCAGDGRQRFVDRRHRPRHQAAEPRPYRLPRARGRVRGPGRGPDRRRRRRAADRDLPGPAADQGRGQRRRHALRRGAAASCR